MNANEKAEMHLMFSEATKYIIKAHNKLRIMDSSVDRISRIRTLTHNLFGVLGEIDAELTVGGDDNVTIKEVGNVLRLPKESKECCHSNLGGG